MSLRHEYTYDVDRNVSIIDYLYSEEGKANCLKCQWLHQPGHWGECEPHKTIVQKPQHHVGNGKPKGVFAGTLTMSPKWPTNEEEMVTAIRKIMKQKTCPVKRYVWYLEYTKDNVPHVHFIYETVKGGRITQQVFKRQWSYWDESQSVGSGHIGGYHRHCASQDDYIEYIRKDSGRHENKWTE